MRHQTEKSKKIRTRKVGARRRGSLSSSAFEETREGPDTIGVPKKKNGCGNDWCVVEDPENDKAATSP